MSVVKASVSKWTGVCLALSVCGLFVSCPSSDNQGSIEITGTFSYPGDLLVTQDAENRDGTSPPKWEGAPKGQSVEYSSVVSPPTEGISVDPEIGYIVLIGDIPARVYEVTVTATGIGLYTGTKQTTVTVTVSDKLGLYYGKNEYTVVKGERRDLTAFPFTINKGSLELTYSASLSNGDRLPSGFSIDAESGNFTIESGKITAAGTYVVKITVTGTSDTRTETASFEITVIATEP